MFRNGTYTYGGNLTSANNHMADGETWTFVYVIADRLTKVRENNQDIMEMTYAAMYGITDLLTFTATV